MAWCLFKHRTHLHDMVLSYVQNVFLVGCLVKYRTCHKSRDSSVGIALDYGLDDRGSRVRFPAGNFSVRHRVQNGSGAHPAYLMGTRGSFPGGKAAEA
jgi:hypothetical protein